VEEPGAVSAEAVEVPLSLAGERVDRAVALLTGRTRADAGRLVDSGGVTLDGGPVERRSRRLRAGEQLAIDMSRLAPALGATVLQPAPPGSVDFKVVYEAADFVVVDKPAGVVTHPGAGNREATLAAGLLARYPELARLAAGGFGAPDRPGIVHRLDKETSGLLVVARSPEGYSSLVAQLAARTAKRTYVALVNGRVTAHEGVVDGPIGRSDRDPTAMAVVANGREARTSYRVRRRFTEPVVATELELQLETGRTHQIRVHLAAIGHPVLGDSRYGGSRRAAGGQRLMLHAERLGLCEPRSGKLVEFTAPPPAAFLDVLSRFS
jgi:23S rRNA pseudouridine1911/1915/1917 synthase